MRKRRKWVGAAWVMCAALLVMDASHADSGYLMIKYTGDNPRIKVQVTRNTVYTYDLNFRDRYEVYPFTEGDGRYSVKVFENICGNQYSQLMSYLSSSHHFNI